MKRISYIFIYIIVVFALSNNINSITNKIDYTNSIENNKNINHTSSTLIDYDVSKFSDFKLISLQKINDSYYLNNTLLNHNDVKQVNSKDLITLEYKDQEGTTLKSVYKKIDVAKGYAHFQNILVHKNNINQSYVTFNFKYNLAKYETTTDLKSGNATYNYQISHSVIESLYEGQRQSNITYYKTNATDLRDNYLSMQYEYINNTRYLMQKEYNIINKKDVLISTNYYSNNKLLENETIYYINKANPKLYTEDIIVLYKPNKTKTTYYNSKLQIINIVIYQNPANSEKPTYIEYISYHTNGKVKQRNLYNRNLKGNVILSRKLIYLNNGKRYSYKVRNYKVGKVVKQKYYRYNKNGLLKKGAYRKTVLYNKSKAYKAYLNTYSSKGNISKAKTIKLTKNLSKW